VVKRTKEKEFRKKRRGSRLLFLSVHRKRKKKGKGRKGSSASLYTKTALTLFLRQIRFQKKKKGSHLSSAEQKKEGKKEKDRSTTTVLVLRRASREGKKRKPHLPFIPEGNIANRRKRGIKKYAKGRKGLNPVLTALKKRGERKGSSRQRREREGGS